MIDLRVGLKELLGIPMTMISEEFLNRLDTFVGRFNAEKDPYMLSPGARLLQGVMLVDGPFAEMPHMMSRIRGLAVLITALEELGKDLEGATKDEDRRIHGTSTLGKDHDAETPGMVSEQDRAGDGGQVNRMADKVIPKGSGSGKRTSPVS